MTEFKLGTLFAFKNYSRFYYYLVLSKPMFFGCQWAYAFHRTTEQLLIKTEVFAGYGEGFHALIDVKKGIETRNIFKVGEGINTTPYQGTKNSKVRIDKPGGGHVWYIFNPKLQILRKQKALKSTQFNLPVVSGLTYKDAIQLIDKKWRTEQVVQEEGLGRFPI